MDSNMILVLLAVVAGGFYLYRLGRKQTNRANGSAVVVERTQKVVITDDGGPGKTITLLVGSYNFKRFQILLTATRDKEGNFAFFFQWIPSYQLRIRSIQMDIPNKQLQSLGVDGPIDFTESDPVNSLRDDGNYYMCGFVHPEKEMREYVNRAIDQESELLFYIDIEFLADTTRGRFRIPLGPKELNEIAKFFYQAVPS